MSMVTADDRYLSQDWPKVTTIVEQLLRQEPGHLTKISVQAPIRIVYQGVCERCSEQMYTALIEIVTKRLQLIAERLKQISDPLMLVQQFSYYLSQYKQALKAIIPLFHHLGRYYVAMVLYKDLASELNKLFNHYVSDNSQLFVALDTVSKRAFTIDPNRLGEVVRQLHELDPEYARRAPEVFARFIPNVFGYTDETDLPALMRWTNEIQERFKDKNMNSGTIGNQMKRKIGND